ncbi:ATP-binding protein [Xylanibacillus composti]|uniref:histidine kinase n=1 Tax=Xylanibacillus composti TaxID=1572762 RepID=A0A8J4H1M1_9BACL|nr:ATP-binding protein [Xylanibacillus composti]GIQ69287.1 hypothetical protein XYCOK13_21110 [Xylanibacillus composti]
MTIVLVRITAPLLVLLITLYVIIEYDVSSLTWMLTASGILMLTSALPGKPIVSGARFASLLAFAYTAKTDWLLILFLMLAFLHAHELKKPFKAKWVFASYGMSFLLLQWIAHSFANVSPVKTAICGLCFVAAYFLTYHYLDVHSRNKQLIDANLRLVSQDPLTGLLNFQEFHKRLHTLIQLENHLALVLIDCADLKSMNSEMGFLEGNRLLKKVAELMKRSFPDAYLLARCGGDEFALVLHRIDEEEILQRLEQFLEKRLPEMTGIQITYGKALYPENGRSKDELIQIAEEDMFMMKRKLWLKREEHMLRSEQLRVVGELASGMAHEIRNPLTTIKGFLQISKTNHYNIEPWYELILDEITRMSDLTGEFLQLSRNQTTMYEVEPLQHCLQRVKALVEAEAIRLGFQLEYLPYPKPLPVWMDQDKLIQVLINIVKNAFEAMEPGGKVTICNMVEHGQAIIDITDEGKGIPEDKLDEIFLPFYTTKDQGTGLGLSICHRIVLDHKGSMEVFSELGKGTTFRVKLPIHAESAEALLLSDTEEQVNA